MRFYKTVTVEKNILDYIECDICHKEFHGDNWGNGLYDWQETKIEMTIGKEYPDSCYVDKVVTFDICPKCFRNKLIPFIKSFQG